MAIARRSASYLDTAIDHFVVVPSDTENHPQVAAALYVGGAGTVQVVSANGNVVPYIVPAGGSVPTTNVRVNANGTTATNIVGLV